MNWQTIFNPFSIFNEKQLVLGGIAATLTGTIVGYLCNGSYNGTLDMHLIEHSNLSTVAIENLINISTVTLLFWGLGKYFNAKTRVIDILNMAFWYRFPIYLVAVLSYLILPNDFNQKITNNIHTPEKIFTNPIDILLSALLGIIILLCLAYAIVLLVNGFKTATNTKKWQQWVGFAFVILLSEGITQYLIKHFV